MAFELSVHAERRCEQRRVPAEVLEKINDRAFMAQAREADGRLSTYHIVRVKKNRYWVAIEREGFIITVIPVGFGSSARSWFKRRLLNYRHLAQPLKMMPVTQVFAADPSADEPSEPGSDWACHETAELARHYRVAWGLSS